MKRIRKIVPEEFDIYPCSEQKKDNSVLVMVSDQQGDKYLFVSGSLEKDFEAQMKIAEGSIFPLSVRNAFILSRKFQWLKPEMAGLKPGFGGGDRIGLATPGHIGAFEGEDVFPVFAQQSIREMERTRKNPREVLTSAIWGVFQEGFKKGYGADADHLMTRTDVKKTTEAGFTFYTCDPSSYVENVNDLSNNEIKRRFKEMPEAEDLLSRYEDRRLTAELKDFDYIYKCEYKEKDIIKAAVKYYNAVKYAKKMYGWIEEEMQGEFDYEVSVDETSDPTSPFEHIFIACELERMGVEFNSLALRFPGEIQKGIDYIGDKNYFENQFKKHAAIAHTYGPYKLSLHSGSDKFSIYPYIGRYARGLFHVKTAGTSYLEAVRVIAETDPEFFKEIYSFALDRFTEDRATYHVDTDIESLPETDELTERNCAGILDDNDGRQLLHITFGSVLSAGRNGEYLFRDRFISTLKKNERLHYEFLADHIGKHLMKLKEGMSLK